MYITIPAQHMTLGCSKKSLAGVLPEHILALLDSGYFEFERVIPQYKQNLRITGFAYGLNSVNLGSGTGLMI